MGHSCRNPVMNVTFIHGWHAQLRNGGAPLSPERQRGRPAVAGTATGATLRGGTRPAGCFAAVVAAWMPPRTSTRRPISSRPSSGDQPGEFRAYYERLANGYAAGGRTARLEREWDGHEPGRRRSPRDWPVGRSDRPGCAQLEIMPAIDRSVGNRLPPPEQLTGLSCVWKCHPLRNVVMTGPFIYGRHRSAGPAAGATGRRGK